MNWGLEAITDAGKEWLVTIDAVPFVIGRAGDCDLKLINKRISRYHSEIRISGGMLWIRDLGSTNGTFINKKKIKSAQLLEPDDVVSIGNYRFKVKSVDGSITSATAHDTVFGTLSKKIIDFSSMEPKLLQLIQGRNVIPHFQPIVRFSDQSTEGYEILGRIDDSDLPSNPSELLEMAESLGCATELSVLFREVGIEASKKLPGSSLLFVNSTKFEISDLNGLLTSLRRIQAIAGTHKIVLEINEKAAADTDNFPKLHAALAEMKMGLAFDDFGVGETRLVELSNISPDYLKFDMSLIRQIHLAPKRLHQMIITFIKAAHDLGILTLAEGIEEAEEAKVCQQLGFDLGQGYFFGHPALIDAI